MTDTSLRPLHPRVPTGVPTGGQFAASTRAESQVSLGADSTWDALGDAVEQIRREAYAHGMRDGIERAAVLIHDFDGPSMAVEGYEIHLASGGKMRLDDTVAYDIADRSLAAASDSLRAYACGGFDQEADPSGANICATCRGNGYGYDVSPGLRRGECATCRGTGLRVLPPTPLGQDVVKVPGWGPFHRRRDGVYPNTPDALRFEAHRPLSDDEVQRMAQLVGYGYAATVRGERLPDPVRDSTHSFIIGADTTKSRSDDLGVALEDFEETLPGLLRDGSPVRTTDRAGAGTKGTRLVEGFGDPDLRVEIYYDDVTHD